MNFIKLTRLKEFEGTKDLYINANCISAFFPVIYPKDYRKKTQLKTVKIFEKEDENFYEVIETIAIIKSKIISVGGCIK